MDRREGEGKIFCTFSSLEAFNEDRLTRSLKELVAEREKVILIIIIAVCVQSLWLCVFFLRDLVAELSIQYSFWCLSSVVRFVPYLGKILTEVIDEDADDSKSRLIYFIIGFRLGWKKDWLIDPCIPYPCLHSCILDLSLPLSTNIVKTFFLFDRSPAWQMRYNGFTDTIG